MQESVLDNIGTPVLSLVTGFLKTNPVAAKAAQTFAAAPATQAFIKTISGIAIGIGPTEGSPGKPRPSLSTPQKHEITWDSTRLLAPYCWG